MGSLPGEEQLVTWDADESFEIIDKIEATRDDRVDDSDDDFEMVFQPHAVPANSHHSVHEQSLVNRLAITLLALGCGCFVFGAAIYMLAPPASPALNPELLKAQWNEKLAKLAAETGGDLIYKNIGPGEYDANDDDLATVCDGYAYDEEDDDFFIECDGYACRWMKRKPVIHPFGYFYDRPFWSFVKDDLMECFVHHACSIQRSLRLTSSGRPFLDGCTERDFRSMPPSYEERRPTNALEILKILRALGRIRDSRDLKKILAKVELLLKDAGHHAARLKRASKISEDDENTIREIQQENAACLLLIELIGVYELHYDNYFRIWYGSIRFEDIINGLIEDESEHFRRHERLYLDRFEEKASTSDYPIEIFNNTAPLLTTDDEAADRETHGKSTPQTGGELVYKSIEHDVLPTAGEYDSRPPKIYHNGTTNLYIEYPDNTLTEGTWSQARTGDELIYKSVAPSPCTDEDYLRSNRFYHNGTYRVCIEYPDTMLTERKWSQPWDDLFINYNATQHKIDYYEHWSRGQLSGAMNIEYPDWMLSRMKRTEGEAVYKSIAPDLWSLEAEAYSRQLRNHDNGINFPLTAYPEYMLRGRKWLINTSIAPDVPSTAGEDDSTPRINEKEIQHRSEMDHQDYWRHVDVYGQHNGTPDVSHIEFPEYLLTGWKWWKWRR